MRSLSRYPMSLAALTAAVILAACSGTGGQPPATGAGAPVTSALSAALSHAGTTAGVVSVSRAGTQAHRAWLSPEAKSGKGLLYVSSYNENFVSIYKLKGSNQSPIGTITAGLSGPEGMAVDRNLNLYVTNTSNNTVTVYPPGQTSPSATYSQGLNEPAGVAVGTDGIVYVANLGGSIVEYPANSMTPSLTIPATFPIDIALDKKNNMYATYGFCCVEKFAPGSSHGTDLGIELSSNGGIQIDGSNDVVVANQVSSPQIDVFPPGQTQPSEVFGQEGDPNPIRFDHKTKNLYVGEPTSNTVNVYAYPSGVQVNTITSGVSFPAGVAVSPESKY